MPKFRRTAAIVLALFSILALAAPVAAKPGSGNSTGSAACENGGYLNWTRDNGSAFKNEGDCTKYAAKGGTLVAVQYLTVSYRVGVSTGTFHIDLEWGGYPANTAWTAEALYGNFIDGTGGFSVTASSGTSSWQRSCAGEIAGVSFGMVTGVRVGQYQVFPNLGIGLVASSSHPAPDATICPPA